MKNDQIDAFLATAWKKYDLNDDGYLQFNEAKKLLQTLYADNKAFGQTNYETMFSMFDSNSDGKLSKDEFRAMLLKQM